MTVTLEQLLEYIDSSQLELSGADIKTISRAYKFGEKAHAGQRRASGEDYFAAHCVPVAMHLVEIGMDTNMIVAGLLHDTIEDTEVTAEDVCQEFGEDVTELVEGVSKLGKIRYIGNERHVESLRKFFVAVAQDVRVVILKLCDRWHNLETLEYLSPSKQKRIAQESMLVHGMLASRLSMGKLTSIINDLAFPYAYPEDYKRTKQVLDSHIKNSEIQAEDIYKDMLRLLTEEFGETPPVDRRTKGIYSLYKKLERKKWAIENIYDLIAIRVIMPTPTDCYLALGAIHGRWRPVPGRVKDYIAVPKPNGYQSLHTAIFSGKGPIIEVQIRTPQMHEFAEYGIAAHHGYKQSNHGEVGEKFNWMQQLGELQTETRTPSEFLKELRTDFFHDRIFAMTPAGDVIDLPSGATVLDFAFAVHTDIGLCAQGGKVNGTFKALRTVLQSEDIVEVETNKNATPKAEWLEWSVTNLAHSRIRNKLGLQRKYRPAKNLQNKNAKKL